MKTPKKFRLGGSTWRVVLAKHLAEYGRCDPTTNTIYVRYGMPLEVEHQTFCHELFHAILFTLGERDHDEAVVDRTGHLLHQFLTTAR